jgi:hypothetical protein
MSVKMCTIWVLDGEQIRSRSVEFSQNIFGNYMDLKVTGVVSELLQEQSGQGKNGTWRKREFILETQEQYPKKICMVQWGDEIDASNVQPGEQITASIDVQSREYNGRWYTDVKAWKIEKMGGGGAQTTSVNDVEIPVPPEFDDDDLPF